VSGAWDSDVVSGARIRAERIDGSGAVEGTVDRVDYDDEVILAYPLRGAANIYPHDYAITVLEAPKPPVPTEPGFYVSAAWSGETPGLGYHLSDRGEWFIIWSFGGTERRTPDELNLPLIRLVKESA
jgi:hypothetical protein